METWVTTLLSIILNSDDSIFLICSPISEIIAWVPFHSWPFQVFRHTNPGCKLGKSKSLLLNLYFIGSLRRAPKEMAYVEGLKYVLLGRNSAVKGLINSNLSSKLTLICVEEYNQCLLNLPHWTVTSSKCEQNGMLLSWQEVQISRQRSEWVPQLNCSSQMGWVLFPGLQNIDYKLRLMHVQWCILCRCVVECKC